MGRRNDKNKKNQIILPLNRRLPSGAVIKKLPAMHLITKTWVGSLDPEDPLEEEMATCSSILSWKSHGQRNLAGYGPQDHRNWT